MTEWAGLNIISSIIKQQTISQEVDILNQKIDTCIAVYHVSIHDGCACGCAEGFLLGESQPGTGIQSESTRTRRGT